MGLGAPIPLCFFACEGGPARRPFLPPACCLHPATPWPVLCLCIAPHVCSGRAPGVTLQALPRNAPSRDGFATSPTLSSTACCSAPPPPSRPTDARRFLLCTVGVGRAFILDDPDGERKVPPGYDSLYVQAPVDTDGDGRVSSEEFAVAVRGSQRRHIVS